MSSGSRARLIARMAASAGSPSSACEILHLALSDAMLAGAGSVHGQRALHQAFQKIVHACNLGRIVEVDQHADMEIAVADMADDRAEQIALGDVALRFSHAFGEPRDRNADVARQRARAGAQGALRPIGVVPRLPQPGAVLGAGRPVERAAAEFLARFRRTVATARRRSLRSREIRATTAASPATSVSNRRWMRAPATHRAVRSALPECRTEWS